MKPVIKESKRSEEVRDQLRQEGFRSYWDCVDGLTRVTYYTNGEGKSLLLVEHAHDLKWESWDLYRPLTTSNKITDTFQSLSEYKSDTPVLQAISDVMDAVGNPPKEVPR